MTMSVRTASLACVAALGLSAAAAVSTSFAQQATPQNAAPQTAAPQNATTQNTAPQNAAPDAPLAKVTLTRAQADRGRAEYSSNCLDCHGAALDDGEFGGPPLKGAGFKEKWFGTTADGLYGFISTAMPPDRPGRLSPQVYADITAYLLSQNGIQPGTGELPADLDALSTLMVE